MPIAASSAGDAGEHAEHHRVEALARDGARFERVPSAGWRRCRCWDRRRVTISRTTGTAAAGSPLVRSANDRKPIALSFWRCGDVAALDAGEILPVVDEDLGNELDRSADSLAHVFDDADDGHLRLRLADVPVDELSDRARRRRIASRRRSVDARSTGGAVANPPASTRALEHRHAHRRQDTRRSRIERASARSSRISSSVWPGGTNVPM